MVVPTRVPVTSTRSPISRLSKKVALSVMLSPLKLVMDAVFTVTPRTVKLWPGTMLSTGPCSSELVLVVELLEPSLELPEPLDPLEPLELPEAAAVPEELLSSVN